MLQIRLQPRKQLHRIAVVDRLPLLFAVLEPIDIQSLRHRRNRLGRRIREIASEQNPPPRREFGDQWQGVLVRRQRRVVVELAAILPALLGRLLGEPAVGEKVEDAVGEVRKCTASMCENDLDIREFADGVHGHEIDCRAAGFVAVVDHGLREHRIHEIRFDGVGGVHEHHRAALVQLGPDGAEGRVPEVVVLRAVARVQRHAVGAEVVQAVRNFREG